MRLCLGCARIARASISTAPQRKRSRFSVPSRNGRCGFRFCAARAAPSGEPNWPSAARSSSVRGCRATKKQLYEVDGFITNYRLSLVGAYSLRRRLDFRIERRTSCSQAPRAASLSGLSRTTGRMLDRWQRGRRVASALDDSLVHFKGLVEYKRDAAVLADF